MTGLTTFDLDDTGKIDLHAIYDQPDPRDYYQTLVNLDYQILDSTGGANGESGMEVLLVAAKKDRIGDYTGVIAQAGKTPAVIDVDAFALQNAYEANYGLEAGQIVVLLNAGASAINVNIVQDGQSVFTRDISMGGNSYTAAIQKELDLPFDAAEQLKKGVPVDGATFEDAQPVLHKERADRERRLELWQSLY